MSHANILLPKGVSNGLPETMLFWGIGMQWFHGVLDKDILQLDFPPKKRWFPQACHQHVESQIGTFRIPMHSMDSCSNSHPNKSPTLISAHLKALATLKSFSKSWPYLIKFSTLATTILKAYIFQPWSALILFWLQPWLLSFFWGVPTPPCNIERLLTWMEELCGGAFPFLRA